MIPQKIPHIRRADFSSAAQKNLDARISRLISRLPGTIPSGKPASQNELHYFSSPGRTELGGNHTDHNHGCVLAASVDLDMLAVARARADRIVTVTSEGYDPIIVDLSDSAVRVHEQGTPAAIIRGLAGWLEKRSMSLPRGFDIAIDSEVPAGSGLSSSAAFELLIAAVFDDFGELGLSPVEWAIAGQYADAYFGKPCGLMDQIACAVGGIVSIDFAEPAQPLINSIAYNFALRNLVLAIVDTGSNHEDLTHEYAAIPNEMKEVAAIFGKQTMRDVEKADLLARAAQIRRQCGDRAFLRAWHFVHETERPAFMQAALERNDLASYLSLVRESGRSSWMYLQNIHAGDPRQQSLAIALALSEDLLGSEGAWRVHGGGFAGTIQVYVPEPEFPAFSERMEAVFGRGCVRRLNIRPFGMCRIIED